MITWAELAALFEAWRQDIDSVPFPDLVDVDAALAIIREGRA